MSNAPTNATGPTPFDAGPANALSEGAVQAVVERFRSAYDARNVDAVVHARSYYDKLSILQQVASEYPGAKGWFFRNIVNFVVAQGEKGLERS